MKTEFLITSTEWHIDLLWGMRQLSEYLHEMSLVDAGVPYSELGISERREKSKSFTIVSNSGSQVVTTLSDNISPGSIAKLSLSGTMRVEDGMCSQGVRSLANQLTELSNHPSIEGILLSANSGGGESMSGQILRNAISDSSVPVVVHADMLGSAAVSGTLTASEIVASGKQSQIGSIGSYISVNKEFLTWYKENISDYYSDVSDNKNADFRSLLEGDASKLIKAATDSAIRFQGLVKQYRNLKGNVEDTLKGGMFPAELAKRRGLVDTIGTEAYAIKRLKSHISYK